MKLNSLILCCIAALAMTLNAQIFKAHDPAWRGVWIWEAPQSQPPVLNVNLSEWVRNKPGACEQALLNRIFGNAAIAGYREIRWQSHDQEGKAISHPKPGETMLNFPNWGLDFGAFDYFGEAQKLARMLGMTMDVDTLLPSNANSALTLDGTPTFLPTRTLTFKKSFTVNGPINDAPLCITANGRYTLWLDDTLIGSDGDWSRGETYQIAPLLTPGKHVIKVEVIPDKTFRGLLVNFNCGNQQIDTDLTWLCKAEADATWKPVIATGFSGAGARFRLKEPWQNHRPLAKQDTLAVPSGRMSYQLVQNPFAIPLLKQKTTRQIIIPCDSQKPDLTCLDITCTIKASTPALTLGICPRETQGKDIPLDAYVWIMWNGQEQTISYFAKGWRAFAHVQPGKQHTLRICLDRTSNSFSAAFNGQGTGWNLPFRNPVRKGQTGAKIVLYGRAGGKGWIDINGMKADCPLAPATSPAEARQRRVVTRMFQSKALGRPLPYTVLFPEDFDKAKTYPVLYLLHGRGRNERSLVDHPQALETLANFKGIIVFPRGEDGWYINSPVIPKAKYGDYISELMDVTNDTLPISRDRNHRGIAGWSMGGYGAVMTAAAHKNQFKAVAPIIGLVDFPGTTPGYKIPTSRFGTNPTQWKQLNPINQMDELRDMDVLLITADKCFTRNMNENFLAKLQRQQTKVTTCMLKGRHQFTVVIKALETLIPFMNKEI